MPVFATDRAGPNGLSSAAAESLYFRTIGGIGMRMQSDREVEPILRG
jgi:hypothetical protein